MAASVYGIGVSGLNAASLGLTTTGHNIANVNTEGFSRQGIKQSAPYPLGSGSGFNGLGVKVDSIKRVFDQFLTKAVEVAQTQSSYQSTRLSHLSEINNIVADPTAGVSPALQDFFSSVQNVATNPANPPSRQAMLSSAQTLVNRFQVFSQRLNEQRSALNGEIDSTVSSINAYAAQVGDLNNQIVIAQGSGQPPNDLLDMRDSLVKDLNKLIKTTSLPLSDGSINLFVGNGQGLVVGSQTYTLGSKPNPGDPENMSITYEQGGSSIILPDNLVSGGQLGALLDYRNLSLDLAQNSLERTALGLVDTFNQQHKAGQDLYGKMGQNFFDLPRGNTVDLNVGGVIDPVSGLTVGGQNLRVTSAANAIPNSDFSIKPSAIAGEFVITRLSDGLNSASLALGSTDPNSGLTISAASNTLNLAPQNGFSFPPDIGVIRSNTANSIPGALLTGSINNIGALTSSNYEFSFDGTNYALTRQSDGQKKSYTPAEMARGISHDGISLHIESGAMVSGDRFTIKPLDGVIDGLAVRITDPLEIAAGAPISAVLPGQLTVPPAPIAPSIVPLANSNTGSLNVTQPLVDAPSLLTTDPAINPALKNKVDVVFTSNTQFVYTDTVTGVSSAAQVYTPGMTLSVNGWSMKLDGKPAANDWFRVDLNKNANADNRNALTLGKLQTTRVLEGGSATYQESYGRMVSTVGTQTSEAKIMGKAQDKLLLSAENSRDSVSAVNLDEEAANLLRYQQAYQAASKVIQIAQKAFDEIVNLGR